MRRQRILFLGGPWHQEHHDIPAPLEAELHVPTDYGSRISLHPGPSIDDHTPPPARYHLTRILMVSDPIPLTCYVEERLVGAAKGWGELVIRPILDTPSLEPKIDADELEASWRVSLE